MTLRELVDEVMFRTGNQESPDPATIIRMLNRAQQDTSRELGLPMYFVAITGVDGMFALPAGARDTGLIEVRRAVDGTWLEILTAEEASYRYPNWEDWDPGEPLFVVYDPKMIGAQVRPVPLPEAGDTYDYDIKYVAKPADMAEFTEEPWDGQFTDYHALLVHKVCYEVLMSRQDPMREEHYSFYASMLRDAYQATRPRPLRPRNPLHRRIFGGSNG